ncbi:asparaginase [Poseidonocella pacifica]|uniref:Asparaginase n=1 Tax=Poseidonocella pacifica TaxID=871651 RepID=A0A1I0WCH0_9RHOB|nr:asparaginase [Poseidonocella pacifica]SFA86455.1 asparaginase [Poseidonocella pacifica]
MTDSVPLVELWRGEFLESVHAGHAVISDGSGTVVEAWGNADAVILPRSSVKMIQALPLATSEAGRGLSTRQLAFACASHDGAALHTNQALKWLEDLGLAESDLRCGPQLPADHKARRDLICSDGAPNQTHNNCSGKHCGFLMLNQHLGGDAEYVDPSHPVQRAVRDAFEEVTGENSPGFGIDGCSAPNFATTMTGLARAMSRFASAREGSGAMADAMVRLHGAMALHPDLVAGEGRACTELMRAMDGRVAIKTGAEGVYTAMIPERGLGIAVKISDGATRAAECVIAALLVRLGVLAPDHPATLRRMDAPLVNRRGIDCGAIRPVQGLWP